MKGNFMYHNIYIIIPSLDPDEKLIHLLDELYNVGFSQIILVDDGTQNSSKNIFDEALLNYPEIIILKNHKNLGKGRALKYAFNYVLNNSNITLKGAITADSDGQHSVYDIQNCANLLLQESPEANVLILGCRDFNSNNVPFRSKFGNKITRIVLKALCGVSVTDTQTGLRGFTSKAMEAFLDTNGERFEYETNMLIETQAKEVEIKEIPIQTIYIEDNGIVNKTSHFNPLKDSIRIYSLFIKFIASSLSSCVLDIILFAIFCNFFSNIVPTHSVVIISTYMARILSSLYNYSLNRCKVFRSNTSLASSAVKYIILCIIQASVSALLVSFTVSHIMPNKVISKIIVDTLLFFVSFGVQREYVFKEHHRGGNK